MNLDVHDLRRLIERTSAHAERGLETAYLLERVSECVPLGDLHTQLQEERKRVVDGIDDLEAATVGLRALLTTMTELDVYDVDELVETRLEQVKRLREEATPERHVHCADCGDEIDELCDAYCELCASDDDSDGEAFHYASHFKKRPRPSALRVVSLTSDGKSGAMMLVGPLAEVQAAAKLYGAHVRLVAVEAPPVPPAPPEEDAADRAPDGSAS